MKAPAKIEERRRNPRFKVQGMVIAVSRPHSHPPGSIKEISRSGLVIQYRENGSENGWMIPRELDIIYADYVATYHLEKIPVKIVSDIFFGKNDKNNRSVLRRQALAFNNLTRQQENQLGRLIQAKGSTPL